MRRHSRSVDVSINILFTTFPTSVVLLKGREYELKRALCVLFLQVYERGIAMFKWPNVFDIWNTYLTKFIQRYVSWFKTSSNEKY